MRVAIIGGTGLSAMPELVITDRLSVTTDYGEPSAPLVLGQLNGTDVVFLARHGDPHAIPPHRINYRANIDALKQQGVTHIIAINAVGSIRANLRPGMVVLPHQIIDYTYGREQSFWDSSEGAVQHIDFTEPYDEALRQVLHASLNECGEGFVCNGVHAVTQGPRLETAAEIDKLERDGCDIVGMTGMPEAALAREAGIAYASMAFVVNPAAGRSRELITLEQIQAVIDSGMPTVRKVIATSCQRLAQQ